MKVVFIHADPNDISGYIEVIISSVSNPANLEIIFLFRVDQKKKQTRSHLIGNIPERLNSREVNPIVKMLRKQSFQNTKKRWRRFYSWISDFCFVVGLITMTMLWYRYHSTLDKVLWICHRVLYHGFPSFHLVTSQVWLILRHFVCYCHFSWYETTTSSNQNFRSLHANSVFFPHNLEFTGCVCIQLPS